MATTPSPNPLNVRIVPTAYGDLPANWNEVADNNVFWHEEGEGGVVVTRDCVAEAEEAFRTSEVGLALAAWFAANPTHDEIILQPR